MKNIHGDGGDNSPNATDFCFSKSHLLKLGHPPQCLTTPHQALLMLGAAAENVFDVSIQVASSSLLSEQLSLQHSQTTSMFQPLLCIPRSLSPCVRYRYTFRSLLYVVRSDFSNSWQSQTRLPCHFAVDSVDHLGFFMITVCRFTAILQTQLCCTCRTPFPDFLVLWGYFSRFHKFC